MYIKNVEDFFLRSEEEERQTIMPGCGKMFYCTKYFVKKLTAHLVEDRNGKLIGDENTTAISDEETEKEENGIVKINLKVNNDKRLSREDCDHLSIQKEELMANEKEHSTVVSITNPSLNISRDQCKGLCDDSLTDYSSEKYSRTDYSQEEYPSKNDCSSIYILQIAEDHEYLTSVEHLSFREFSRGLNIEHNASESLNDSHACFIDEEIDLHNQQREHQSKGLCNGSFTNYSSSSEHCGSTSSLKSNGSCDSFDLLIANVQAHEALLECLDKEVKCSNFYIDDEIFTKQKFLAVYQWVEQINNSFLFDTIDSFVESSYDLNDFEEKNNIDGEDHEEFQKQQKFLDVLDGPS